MSPRAPIRSWLGRGGNPLGSRDLPIAQGEHGPAHGLIEGMGSGQRRESEGQQSGCTFRSR
jgi:hypothetical protein